MPTINDWAAKAARKIRSEHRGCKEGPTQERIAAIIEMFAEPLIQPVKGVAYMPVPRCDRCMHWDNGECAKPSMSFLDNSTSLSQGGVLFTGPSFGCVQWEEEM